MKRINIAIDGYSACGKSTLARLLAQKLHYIWIDSGAMYRAITFALLKAQIDLENRKAIEFYLKELHLDIVVDEQKCVSQVLLNHQVVDQFLRNMEISESVSFISSLKEVRLFAVNIQQKIGQRKGIVMDGRDIGTTVFPQAELKFFLIADIDVRAKRRLLELKVQQPLISINEVRKNIEERDHIDTQRKISPLQRAYDAIEIDNTHLSIEEELNLVFDLVNTKFLK
ncbi:MAG: (d)CMP kinase [Phycisphaerales bacterium]|nr:(d)CMP kinase [Phycisphaerales bacterium]